MTSCLSRYPHYLVLAFAFVAGLAVAVSQAGAADAIAADKLPPPPQGSEFQLFIENDMLAGTDHYYTNGIKFGIGVPFETLQQVFRIPAKFALDLFTDPGADFHFGLFAGQNLYTPRNITISAPQPYDRPWAAWLYLGGVAQRVKGNRLDTAELDIGMVGPWALGDQVQSEWHSLVGAKQPQGWGNQTPGEPEFLISYLQKRKYGTRHIEFVPHAGVTLGTVMTLARVGGIVRIGRNMTGFGPDGIEPGGAMLQNTRREHEGAGRAPYEWSGFVGADLRYVARNIFLDGTVFRGGPSVDRRDMVHDYTVGVSARIYSYRFSLTRILRSEEFTTPFSSGGTQSFYSLHLGLEF